MTVHTFAPGDLWDNAESADLGGYYQSSTFARAIFDTSARWVDAGLQTNSFSSSPANAVVGILVNGSPAYSCPAPSADGAGTVGILLPPGAKRVEIISSTQFKTTPNGNTMYATYLVSAEFKDAKGGNAVSATLVPPSSANRLVIYGDSIAAGASASIPPLGGWAARLKAAWQGSVLVDAFGYSRFQERASSSGLRAAFATRMTGFSPSKLYLAIGTNDYGIPGSWNAADFGAAYADVLDRIHTIAPTLPIYCQSPLSRGTADEANSAGSTLANYRTQIETAANARSSYCTYIHGPDIMTAAGLSADDLHPSTAGHATLFAAISAILEQSP